MVAAKPPPKAALRPPSCTEGPGTLPLPPYSFLGHLFESHRGTGYYGMFICLNMGGSYRGGCQVSGVEEQLQTESGWSGHEAGWGGGQRTQAFLGL